MITVRNNHFIKKVFGGTWPFPIVCKKQSNKITRKCNWLKAFLLAVGRSVDQNEIDSLTVPNMRPFVGNDSQLVHLWVFFFLIQRYTKYSCSCIKQLQSRLRINLNNSKLFTSVGFISWNWVNSDIHKL